jgi:hypothetical protein
LLNASRHKAMSYGHMLKTEAQLKKEIDALLERARQADEAERKTCPMWTSQRRSPVEKTAWRRSAQHASASPWLTGPSDFFEPVSAASVPLACPHANPLPEGEGAKTFCRPD